MLPVPRGGDPAASRQGFGSCLRARSKRSEGSSPAGGDGTGGQHLLGEGSVSPGSVLVPGLCPRPRVLSSSPHPPRSKHSLKWERGSSVLFSITRGRSQCLVVPSGAARRSPAGEHPLPAMPGCGAAACTNRSETVNRHKSSPLHQVGALSPLTDPPGSGAHVFILFAKPSAFPAASPVTRARGFLPLNIGAIVSRKRVGCGSELGPVLLGSALSQSFLKSNPRFWCPSYAECNIPGVAGALERGTASAGVPKLRCSTPCDGRSRLRAAAGLTAARGSWARWPGGVSTPKGGFGKAMELFSQGNASLSQEKIINHHPFPRPVLQTRIKEDKNWSEMEGKEMKGWRWWLCGVLPALVPRPGTDRWRGGCRAPAARLELFPVFHHLGKKSAYGDDTWVIKINNDRLLLVFSQGKTPGAALL